MRLQLLCLNEFVFITTYYIKFILFVRRNPELKNDEQLQFRAIKVDSKEILEVGIFGPPSMLQISLRLYAAAYLSLL